MVAFHAADEHDGETILSAFANSKTRATYALITNHLKKSNTMRIAITGASGQLGSVLQVALAPQHEIIALGHRDIELSSPACIEQLASTRAELVIHPAAMTNVDGCARDPDQAYRINGLGTRYVALACRKLAAPLVYVSTNEVFDGSGTRPYYEYDQTNPCLLYTSAAGAAFCRG